MKWLNRLKTSTMKHNYYIILLIISYILLDRTEYQNTILQLMILAVPLSIMLTYLLIKIPADQSLFTDLLIPVGLYFAILIQDTEVRYFTAIVFCIPIVISRFFYLVSTPKTAPATEGYSKE